MITLVVVVVVVVLLLLLLLLLLLIIMIGTGRGGDAALHGARDRAHRDAPALPGRQVRAARVPALRRRAVLLPDEAAVLLLPRPVQRPLRAQPEPEEAGLLRRDAPRGDRQGLLPDARRRPGLLLLILLLLLLLVVVVVVVVLLLLLLLL